MIIPDRINTVRNDFYPNPVTGEILNKETKAMVNNNCKIKTDNQNRSIPFIYNLLEIH